MVVSMLGAVRIIGAAAVLVLASHAQLSADTLASACNKAYAEAGQHAANQPRPAQAADLPYACSGTYDGELDKVRSEARNYLEKRANEVSKPALVLDIDETSLSNLPQGLANDFGYIPHIPNPKCKALPRGPCGFDDWVLAALAKPIRGTLALFNAARARGVTVFFITGRRPNEARATVKNLKSAGYHGWHGLALRPANDNRTVAEYKAGERTKITARGYTVIVNVGHQQSDLDGGYAERAYKEGRHFAPAPAAARSCRSGAGPVLVRKSAPPARAGWRSRLRRRAPASAQGE
jgi:predicted secreted acid phosphatase